MMTDLQVQHIQPWHAVGAYIAAVPPHRLVAAAAEGQRALPCAYRVQALPPSLQVIASSMLCSLHFSQAPPLLLLPLASSLVDKQQQYGCFRAALRRPPQLVTRPA